MREQCIQEVARALGKDKLTREQVQNIETRIKEAMKTRAKQDVHRWRSLSETEKLKEAAEQVAEDIRAQYERKLQTAIQDVLKQNKNINLLDHPRLPPSEVLDRMVAPHGDMSGIQSVSSNARAIASLYRGELVEFYTTIKGAMGVFTDKKLVRAIVQERFGENSGNALAKKLSDLLGKTFDQMRSRFNENGGGIGKLYGWGLPQIHDPYKMAHAKIETWVKDTLPLLNRKRYVHEDGRLYSVQELRELLEYSFKAIIGNGANTEVVSSSYGSKVTNRHADNRVLHFKDATSWLAYQSKYGGQQFVDLIESHIQSLSRDIALVEMFGSNPTTAFGILKQATITKDVERGIPANKNNATRGRAQYMFDEFSGAHDVQNATIANLGLAYRSTNVSSLLGSASIMAIGDQATVAMTAHVHGMAYHKAFGKMVNQLNPLNKADRDFARSLGVATEEMLGNINRWADDGLTSVYGTSQKLAKGSNSVAAQVIRLSLLNALTAASKAGFSTLLMQKYGTLSRSKKWTDLDADDRLIMEGTGLSERAWQVMQLADPLLDRKGNALMTARSIYAIPDEKLLIFGDPQPMWDQDDPSVAISFFSRSVTAGGGLPFMGDIIMAGTDSSGRDITSFMIGPFGRDVVDLLVLTVGNLTQYYEGKDTNAANEAYKFAKSKVPAQNLWYTKAATNRLLFDEFQDMIAPGYREKSLRRAEQKYNRTRYWRDDMDDIRMPDFEGVIE